MSEFVTAGTERVNVFVVEEVSLFKHYFDGEAVWDELRRYYNNNQYRFEVPPSDYERVRLFLEEHGYGLVEVEDLDEFAVIVRKYTAHPENIFKGSVLHRSVGDYNVFVMTDRPSVEEAVAAGATRLSEAPIESPF